MAKKLIQVRTVSPRRRGFKRTEPMSVRVSPEELEILRAASEYLGLPVSDITRRGALSFARAQLAGAATDSEN